jgi:peptidyl-prolyl cis-trans isomerase SurA
MAFDFGAFTYSGAGNPGLSRRKAKTAWASVALSALCAASAMAAGAQTSAPAPTQPPQRPAPRTVEAVVSVVNDQVISTFDLRQRAALLYFLRFNQPAPQEEMRRLLQIALNQLEEERLKLAETNRREIRIPDRQVDRAFAERASRMRMTPQQMTQRMQELNLSPALFREQLRNEIAWSALMRGLYEDRISISDNAIDQALARFKADAAKPKYRVFEIFLRAQTEEERAKALQDANEILGLIRGGQVQFDRAAGLGSDSSTAAAGGDMGYLAEGEMKPEMRRVVLALQPEQISAPFTAPDGVYIVYLAEVRQPQDLNQATRVSLRLITAPAAQRSALATAAAAANGCANIASAFTAVQSVQVSEALEDVEDNLDQQVRDLIKGVAEGRATALYESAPDEVSAIMVCARTDGNTVTRNAVENNLFEQEMQMREERYVRGLRRSGAVIRKIGNAAPRS